MQTTTLIFYFIIFLCLLILSFKNDILSRLFKREFKCTNCTGCCKLRVFLSEKDIKRIKTKCDYIRKIGKMKLIKRVNGYCIFLNIKEGKSKCSIYKMRPDICRKFPERKIFGCKSYDPRCPAFNVKSRK